MAPSPDSERGRILPTGWRITGAGADRIAEQAATYAPNRLAPGDAADTLYAVQCTMDSVISGRPAVERVLDTITDDVRRTWPECPRLARDEEVERPASRFGGLRFDALAEPGREWTGEVVWRAVHPVVAGAPITTRVLLEERPSYTRLSVRVTADDRFASVRGYVGAGQAQPAFLRALRREITPVWLGAPLGPRTVRAGGVPDLVRELGSASRTVPIAVLAPLEEGGYVVDPADLAWDLLGRAQLHVLAEHRLTFDLSDTVGDRRMSCYWGAVRAYMPGWSRHDDYHEHPLLIADRLADPVMRAAWLGELGIWSGTRLELPASIEERRSATSPATSPASDAPPHESAPAVDAAVTTRADKSAADVAPATTSQPNGADGATAPVSPQTITPAAPPPAPDHTPLLQRLTDEVRSLGGLVTQLVDEVERLRTIAAVRSSSTAAIERRLGRLEDILEEVFPDGKGARVASGRDADDAMDDADRAGDEGRPPLVDVVRDVAETHADALVFLDSAYRAAAESPYEDPERVRAVLEAMARVARRRRDGVLGTSLREAFNDLGIDYRGAIARSTPARLREQYRFAHNGQAIEAEEHIVLGNTYDPRRCLRIYFSSRAIDELRFVVGHVGRHFEVMTTT
jgi:hypothetical protein